MTVVGGGLQEGRKAMSWRGVKDMTLRCLFCHREGKIRRFLDHLILIVLMKEFQQRGGRSYSLESKNIS